MCEYLYTHLHQPFLHLEREKPKAPSYVMKHTSIGGLVRIEVKLLLPFLLFFLQVREATKAANNIEYASYNENKS